MDDLGRQRSWTQTQEEVKLHHSNGEIKEDVSLRTRQAADWKTPRQGAGLLSAPGPGTEAADPNLPQGQRPEAPNPGAQWRDTKRAW